MSNAVAEIEASLAQVPNDADHARERVDLMNRLGWELRGQMDWDRILQLSDQAMDEAQRHSYQAGLTGAFRNAAFAHYMTADFQPALAKALVALRMAEELDDRLNQANAISVLALVHWSLGNYDEALKEAFRGLAIVEEENHRASMAWAYTIIGGIYQSLRDFQQALGYHEKSHRIFEELGDALGQGRALTGLGTVHNALGDPEAACKCHHRSLDIFREIQNGVGESRALNDIGEIHQERGDLDGALKLHQEALGIRRAQGLRQAEVTSLLNLGVVHLARKEHEAAREHLERARSLAEEIGVRPKLSRAHELLSRLWESAGDACRALHHHKEFQRIKEQVFNEEESTKLKNLQISMEVERSRREAEIQRRRNADLEEKNKELARLLDELRATQSQLVQSEKMAALGDLVAAIAHEINTPLGAIHSSADVALRGAERVVELIEASHSIDELKSRRSLQSTLAALRMNGRTIASASERIGRLVRGLKSFARLDQAEFQEFDVIESIEDTLTLLEPRFGERIRVVKNYREVPRIPGYPAEINQVMMNLLRNAGEAIDGEGTITVTTYADNGSVCVTVADTGRGIPPDHIGRLFNPGFRVEGARVRASMGLFAALHIVQKHRGEIRVDSKVGEGSIFTVRLGLLGAATQPA